MMRFLTAALLLLGTVSTGTAKEMYSGRFASDDSLAGPSMFRPSPHLLARFVERQDQTGHIANLQINMKENANAFNPFSWGDAISDITCTHSAITLTIKDEAYLENVQKTWPKDRSFVFFSPHDQDCGKGLGSTDFLMVKSPVVKGHTVTLTISKEKLNLNDVADDFTLDLDFIEPNNNVKRASWDPNFHWAKNFNLNPNPFVLAQTPASFPGRGSLVCEKCGAFFGVTARGRVHAKFQLAWPPVNIDEAWFSFNGDAKAHARLVASACLKTKWSTGEKTIARDDSLGLDIPLIFHLGPVFDLRINTDMSISAAGSVAIGANVNLHYDTKYDIIKKRWSGQGFKHTIDPHASHTAHITASAALNLKPGMYLELDIYPLNINVKAGVQAIATVGGAVGANAAGKTCSKKQIGLNVYGRIAFEAFAGPARVTLWDSKPLYAVRTCVNVPLVIAKQSKCFK